MKLNITLLLVFTALVAADEQFLRDVANNKGYVRISGESAYKSKALNSVGYEMVPQDGLQYHFKLQLGWARHPGYDRDMYRIMKDGRCLSIKQPAEENDNLYWLPCSNATYDYNQYFFFITVPKKSGVFRTYRIKTIYHDLYIQLDLDDDNCFELEPLSNLDSEYTGDGRFIIL